MGSYRQYSIKFPLYIPDEKDPLILQKTYQDLIHGGDFLFNIYENRTVLVGECGYTNNIGNMFGAQKNKKIKTIEAKINYASYPLFLLLKSTNITQYVLLQDIDNVGEVPKYEVFEDKESLDHLIEFGVSEKFYNSGILKDMLKNQYEVALVKSSDPIAIKRVDAQNRHYQIGYCNAYFVLMRNRKIVSSIREIEELYLNSVISWDKYFMGVAQLSALRSKDPKTQVGACIVSEDNKILSIGYNGFPIGCSDSEFPWESDNKDNLKNKDYYVVHAELNAILNFPGISLKRSKIYVTLFPCCECAKAIIQSGIKEVIYVNDKNSEKYIASKRMFESAGVKCRQYKESMVEINV